MKIGITLPWRVVIDDTGDPITGGFPSICGSEDSDVTIIHWDGFRQEYWGELNAETACDFAQKIVDAVNEKYGKKA